MCYLFQVVNIEGLQELDFDKLFEDDKGWLEECSSDLRVDGAPSRLHEAEDRSMDLVLKDWLERDVVDELTGEYLPPDLLRKAKIEELLEVYRRGVWREST